MRAQGVRPVAAFIVLTIKRRGALDAVRLGLTDRRQRDQAAEDDLAQELAAPVRRSGADHLDKAYALSSSAWSPWASWVGAPPPSADPYEDAFADAQLRFVIFGADVDPQGGARTRAAIDMLGKSLELPANERPADDAWVVFLRAGDLPQAELAREIGRAARGGVAEVVSFDSYRREGRLVFPMLWPGANPTLLQSADYLFGRVALRGALLEGVDLRRADPRRVVLDWVAAQDPLQAHGRWRHIGRPVLEMAISAEDIDAERGRIASRAKAARGETPTSPVSIVICTRDKGHLTRQLVRSLLALPEAQVAEIVLIANGTQKPHALATLEDLGDAPRVQVLHRDEPFNFSRLCNAGVGACTGDGPLLFLNDDIVPVTADWLDVMARRLERPEVGAVGPLLLYPDESVQHAGMYLGFSGCAGHTLRGASLPEEDYLFTASAAREVSSLTGAVLLVRRQAFEAVNGFDDQLASFLQDVDLCLRLRRSGWLNVFDPAAVLLHMESASVRSLDRSAAFHRQREAEHRRFAARWGDALLTDPLHPAGFDPQDEGLRRLSGLHGVQPPFSLAQTQR